MRKSLSVALLASACLTTSLGAQAPGDSLAARVDSIARSVLVSTGVPSASVAVVRGGRLVYAHAYGLARIQPPDSARPEMRYAVGSISKQFTAAAVLLLQEDGKLSLDDKVAKWVPGLTRGHDVTLRMVLSHTSGYQDFWPQDYVPPDMTKPASAAQILTRWAKRPLDFEPGSRWQYSNTNYLIAALAIEKASGMPYFTFIRKRILQPLGMTSALDFDTKGPGSIEPVGYMRYGLGPLRPALSTGAGWMYGAGELAMTASDLAKWDAAMLGHRLLRPSSWRLLKQAVLLDNGTSSGYGLGLFVMMNGGHYVVEHDGEVAGFTADNIVLPDDSAAVIVLTNQDAAPASGAIAQGIARSMLVTPDSLAAGRTAQARAIFEGLQHGTIDRSLLTADANAYFSAQALQDFASSLGPLGAVVDFTPGGKSLRGGMTLRSWRVRMANGQMLRVWTFETPDGKLEQYQVAPIG